jgi:hypothetical protein
MRSTHITYSQRHDARPDQERNVLAAVYKLCLSSRAKKEASFGSRPDDGSKIKEDFTIEHRRT